MDQPSKLYSWSIPGPSYRDFDGEPLDLTKVPVSYQTNDNSRVIRNNVRLIPGSSEQMRPVEISAPSLENYIPARVDADGDPLTDPFSVAEVNSIYDALKTKRNNPTEHDKIAGRLLDALKEDDFRIAISRLLDSKSQSRWKQLLLKDFPEKSRVNSYADSGLNYLASFNLGKMRILENTHTLEAFRNFGSQTDELIRELGIYLADHLHTAAPEEFLVKIVNLPKAQFNPELFKSAKHNLILIRENDSGRPYQIYIRWLEPPGYFTIPLEKDDWSPNLLHLPQPIIDYYRTYFGLPFSAISRLYRPYLFR